MRSESLLDMYFFLFFIGDASLFAMESTLHFQSATFCRIPGLSNSGVSLLTALALGAAIDICRWARTSSKNFDHFKTIPLHNRIDASAFENAKRGEAARDLLIRQGTADYCTGRTSQKRKEVSCVLLRAWRLV